MSNDVVCSSLPAQPLQQHTGNLWLVGPDDNVVEQQLPEITASLGSTKNHAERAAFFFFHLSMVGRVGVAKISPSKEVSRSRRVQVTIAARLATESRNVVEVVQ